MAGSSKRKATKRTQSDSSSDATTAVPTTSYLSSSSSSQSTGSASSGVGSSSSSGSSGSTSKRAATEHVAAEAAAALEAELEELHFEDEFEDEFDDEEEYLKRIVKRKELKKRRDREERRRQQQVAGEESGKEGDSTADHMADEGEGEGEGEGEDEDEDEEEYDDVDDSEDEAAEEKDDTTSERSAAVPASAVDQPFVDVEQHEKQQQAAGKATKQSSKRVWRPADGVSTEEQLDFDSTAYIALHRLKVEWPCLSFDLIPDSLGAQRRTYPHTVYMVGGTQADARNKNKLQVMKIRDLHKTKQDDTDSEEEEEEDDQDTDGKGQETRQEQQEKDEEDQELSDDEGLDIDPIVDERSIPHVGAINRVKVNPLCPQLVATMSDTGKAHIFDISPQLRALDLHSTSAPSTPASVKQPATGPLFTFSGHAEEGYAIAWSTLTAGRLVSGDCAKGLYLWEPKEGGAGWTVASAGFKGHSGSVEDVCWSPGEATVFASASSDRTVRMWDVRMKDKSAAWVAAHKTDVNVISWNCLRQHLLASAADDGSFKVWDLRQFKSHTPAATFTYHTQPITSIEWHPTEDSILAASSDDNSLTVWDLSLETDQEELDRYSKGAQLHNDTPPQLFFVHAGQSHIKELHWHRQIPGMFISTAQDGINIAHPENL